MATRQHVINRSQAMRIEPGFSSSTPAAPAPLTTDEAAAAETAAAVTNTTPFPEGCISVHYWPNGYGCYKRVHAQSSPPRNSVTDVAPASRQGAKTASVKLGTE